MNVALILAGGLGERAGQPVPKQFVEIMGKPVIAYTLEVFQKHPEIDAIAISCHADYIDYTRETVQKYGYDKVKWIVNGGEEYQYSVVNGVDALAEDMSGSDILLIHCGVSPFVGDDLISDGIRVCKEKGNSVSGTPCYFLVGSTEDGETSTAPVDRYKVMQHNTPQTFQYGYIRQLYQEAREKDILDKIEPHTTSLMYELGRTIFFSKGNQANLKITTKEDFDIFEGFLLLRQKREQAKTDR